MHLDSNPLNDLCDMIGREATVVIVRLYVKQTSLQLAQLEKIFPEGVAEDQQMIVHKLCGGSLEIGTDHLSRLCHALETDLRKTHRPLSPEMLEQLRTSAQETIEALAQWLGEPPPSH